MTCRKARARHRTNPLGAQQARIPARCLLMCAGSTIPAPSVRAPTGTAMSAAAQAVGTRTRALGSCAGSKRARHGCPGHARPASDTSGPMEQSVETEYSDLNGVRPRRAPARLKARTLRSSMRHRRLARQGGCECIVQFHRPFVGGACVRPLHVIRNGRPVLDRAELHAPPQLRGHVDVCCGECLSRNVG